MTSRATDPTTKLITTSDATLEQAFAFVRGLGKEAVAAKDSSGFIVNLLLVPYMLDAVRALERGVASTVDIDTAMRLGCGHPMGPLKLTDQVGLDVRLAISEHLTHELGERFRPPQLLRRLVRAGKLGKKSGEGFYKY